ncbi:MAG: HAD family phosphatase [Planctomycetota bacterium]|nr:HAD family phosphatase [Planctomycetota bacterium]
MPEPCGVLFDLDGVLLDSAECHFLGWERLAKELSVAHDRAFFRAHFGKKNHQILPLLLGRTPGAAEMDRLSERKEEHFREAARGALSLYDGIPDLLRRLRAEGLRLALGTSTPRSNVEFLFRELGLGVQLEAFVCANDVSQGKPHPEVFLKGAERLGLAPARCVVVEDAFPGIEAAKAGGMRCVAVATTNSAADLRSNSKADAVLAKTTDLTSALVARLLEA